MTEESVLQRFDEMQAMLNEMKSLTLRMAALRKGDDLTKEQREHQEDLQLIKNFRLIDDDFMNVCFDNNIEATQLLLRIILNNPSIQVKHTHAQSSINHLFGRDVVLDIEAEDETGKMYNIEVRCVGQDANCKKARYLSSYKDKNWLKNGKDYTDLPETHVIFITENDVVGKSKPVYHIERVCKETEMPFNDEQHIIYVNGANRDTSTELGKLMHDFFCTSPDDMYYKELANKVRYLKETEEGVNTMCRAIEEMRAKAAEEASKKAEKETTRALSIEFIQSIMRKLACTVEQAMDLLGIPEGKRPEYAGVLRALN